MKKIAVLISGRGSNMIELAKRCREDAWPARIVAVISNRPGAAGLEAAAGLGLHAEAIDHTAFADRADFDAALARRLEELGVDWIALAGFMRVLGEPFVERFAGRIVNIHPSLLPAFPGLHTHRRALEAGVRLHGATVHLVTSSLDLGPIVAQAAAHGDSGETLLKENIVQFRQALASLLLRLVNGHPAENDVVKARTAKLGYARAFLQTLAQTIERAGQNLALARSQAAAEADTGCALLAEFIHRQEAALKEESESLDKTIVFLAGDPERTARARQGEAMGVLDDLRELVLREKEWRAELGRIPVRKTLADEGLLNQMYTDYFAPAVVEQGLERLYWRAGEKGKLELVVRHQQDVAFAPEASNKAKFIEALLELAENVGQEVWKLELGPILDDPDTGLWVAPSARREVGEAAAWAEPAATVQVGKAREQLPHRYLWANRTIGRADDYAREVQLQAAAQSGVQSLVATHPYRAMLITTLDVVPLSALDCTARLGELYLSTFIRPPAENRVNLEPVHVFAAERNALSYEQRLRELAEAPRRFHPLFVAALEDLERARWFALAYAVGWVQTVQVREGGDWRQQYVLRLEGQQERKLTRPDDPGNPVALLVRAMQGFVLGDDPSAEVDPAHPVEEAVQAVRMIIEERVASSEERLDSFARTFSAATLNDRRAGAQDLASFVRLVVHDEIRAIRERSMRGGG